MLFHQPQFERLIQEEKEEDKKREFEKIEDFMGEIVGRLEKEGMPVKDDCRVNMEAFGGIYPEKMIKEDQEFVKDYEKKWYGEFSKEEEIKEAKSKSSGEKFEMLKTAIFSKFFGEDFILARTSLYDDIKNKVDNIVLEKESLNIICAFDEVGETIGSRYEEKKTKILEKNKEEGGRLKYGSKLERGKNNQIKIVLGEITNIPIFYLALSQRHIEEGIRQLIPSFEEKNDYEKKLFNYFLGSLSSQVDFLKLESGLTPVLKDRLNLFDKTLQKLFGKN